MVIMFKNTITVHKQKIASTWTACIHGHSWLHNIMRPRANELEKKKKLRRLSKRYFLWNSQHGHLKHYGCENDHKEDATNTTSAACIALQLSAQNDNVTLFKTDTDTSLESSPLHTGNIHTTRAEACVFIIKIQQAHTSAQQFPE